MEVRDVSRRAAEGIEIDIIVSPNSGRQGTEGTDEWRRRLIIRVRSPPSDGKANKEVEEFMKNITGCPCEIIRGHRNRQKTVMVLGDPDKIIRSLEEAQ
ncbi:MAG: DUF167 domain-containing protein [Methanomassiliicoccaceae archaeon]|jgi:uncharacterized protein (TIGR00251 family)|nr:DUF167 domain-containing protein [Methanomassiliicoccaceae archaeon]